MLSHHEALTRIKAAKLVAILRHVPTEKLDGVVEALIATYVAERNGRETFIDTLRRTGPEAFKLAANAARMSTRRPEPAESVAA